MPFGYLLATLSTKAQAMQAAVEDPNRKLPELVYTMFVPLSKKIQRVGEAHFLELLVKVRMLGGCPGRRGRRERRGHGCRATWWEGRCRV